MQDRADDTEYPRVRAGCYRRQRKSRLGIQNLATTLAARREVWLAIGPSSPARVTWRSSIAAGKLLGFVLPVGESPAVCS
jgi:hypothetical protein